MASNRDYVIMLRESLEKKVDVLRILVVRNQEQAAILKNPMSEPDELEKNINLKAELIDRITMLDDGFEQLFNKVKPEVEAHREEYADEIKKMQDLIRRIADLTADVEAAEYKNREYAKEKFAKVKSDAREIKKNSEVVSKYYKTMMNPSKGVDPAFLDRKK
ncbi:MAG: flagellar protein FliT [Pseudobutyrivibrio sp.]|nr:flagellar protein FliT [Pseudobutyrivibrio sp.]